jgi:hypothetical protein
MTEAKYARANRRGRIFPQIQWTEEQKALRRAEDEEWNQRCKVIFSRIKPQYIETHYNWYMVVEPDSRDYFIDADEEVAMLLARQKHPGTIPLFLFRINETGVSGTI